MDKWNSSPHPISDIRDWHDLGRLEIQPDFQRRAVWTLAAKIMLMDTIINDIPMPKIFISSTIKDKSTYRTVIDGQQRIRSILSFLRDKFSLEQPYDGPYLGKFFSELPEAIQGKFLQYSIDFNEAVGLSEAEVRAVYSRVNKYTVALNKQELRRADYPGTFLDLAEDLALNDYLDEIKVFSATNRRRCLDVEYVSELLAGLIDGAQDKKDSLDSFYLNYRNMEIKQVDRIKGRFGGILSDISTIFDGDLIDISKSRFRQKADLYSLFLVINNFKKEKLSLKGKDLKPLREDLKFLDQYIEPESEITLLSEYAIKCVSQANTINSRSWRQNFIESFLSGTYKNTKPVNETLKIFTQIQLEIAIGDGICPTQVYQCLGCDADIIPGGDDVVLTWPENVGSFQLSNSVWTHAKCDKG